MGGVSGLLFGARDEKCAWVELAFRDGLVLIAVFTFWTWLNWSLVRFKAMSFRKLVDWQLAALLIYPWEQYERCFLYANPPRAAAVYHDFCRSSAVHSGQA